MTYQQTLEYLFSSLPMFSRIGSAAFKKDLTNIIALCSYLDNPHTQFKSIHIGGTNGKGSVSHMLAAILQTAGYKTGLYTSPHLKDFRERIRVNGAMVDEDFVVRFVQRIKPVSEQIQPSFFEITVAMAFEFFAQQKVDVAVVEVGLGGRLDSTNIITPELSIITNIGWDHMNILGDTLQKIAVEKAGIIKKEIPVVIGETQPETETLFKNIADERAAPIYFADEYFKVKSFQIHSDYIDVAVINTQTNQTQNYGLDLPGIYQTKNIRTVLQAVELLNKKDWQLKEEKTILALKQVKEITGLHGRWEVIHSHPTVVLEVAHNEDGIQQLLLHLQQLHYNHLHIVFGIVKDKETDHVLKLLPTGATYYFTAAHIPRAMDAATLKMTAAKYQLQGEEYENVNTALQQALATANADDLIIVCGSIFLVAEVEVDSLPQSIK